MSPSCCNAWICSTSSPKSSKSNPPSTNLNQILSSSFSPQLFEVLKMGGFKSCCPPQRTMNKFYCERVKLIVHLWHLNKPNCFFHITIFNFIFKRNRISENSYHVTSLIAIECGSCSACRFDKKLMFSVPVILNEWHCKNVYCEFFQCICLYLYLLIFWVLKQ